MRRLQGAQAEDEKRSLERERKGQRCDAFFLAPLESPLSARFREHSPVFGKQQMAKEWVAGVCFGLPPKPRRPPENEGGLGAPVLKQVNQRILVIKVKQSWLKGIQLVAHQVMKGHSRVLCRALNQPIQRE